MFGKHIKLKGLMDSGNSLYDSATGLPVIVIEKPFFEKCFAEQLKDIKVLRQISCVVASDVSSCLPIIGMAKVQISHGRNTQIVHCSIAVSNGSFGFDNSRSTQFNCLLHRDFL